MLRFTYTGRNQLVGFTCRDCEKHKKCPRELKYRSDHYEDKRDVCWEFRRVPRDRPKVIISEDDCRELLHQIMLMKLISRTIQHEYMRDWVYPTKQMSGREPPFSECEMFIKVLDVFREHIIEYKEMYSNSRIELSDLIQTIFCVKGKEVMAHFELGEQPELVVINFLREKMKDMVEESGYQFEEYEYNELYHIKVR